MTATDHYLLQKRLTLYATSKTVIQRVADHQSNRPTVTQHVIVVRPRQQRVNWHGYRPDTDGTPEHSREFKGIEHAHEDTLLSVHTQCSQRCAGSPDTVHEISIGMLTCIINERNPFAMTGVQMAIYKMLCRIIFPRHIDT